MTFSASHSPGGSTAARHSDVIGQGLTAREPRATSVLSTIADAHVPTPPASEPVPPVASPDVFRQLGEMARQLHDTMSRLSVLPRLGELTGDLPDARSRLTYIASKTGEAAEQVLNLVDVAKLEKAAIAESTRTMARAIVADPVRVVAGGQLIDFVRDIEAATGRLDAHLTSIMLAQDFHDLTGQVVNKVVALAAEMETQLLQLLIQTEPSGQAAQVATFDRDQLDGPVVSHEGRTDVVASQEQVDDLLASMGF
jgi:chemotaxis protein CheZ